MKTRPLEVVALASVYLLLTALSLFGATALVAVRLLPFHALIIGLLHIAASITVIVLDSKARAIVLEYTAIPT